MKLLFIENRYATKVYEHVAMELEKEGYEIHWLIQNHIFCPKFGKLHILPFPKFSRKKFDAGIDDYKWLAKSDRGALHFGVEGRHYPHYSQHILQVLEEVMPDVIFGEPTEFHELIAIRHAKKMGIMYLSPNATRYPPGRLVFFEYDTLHSFGGDGSIMSDYEAADMIESINSKKVVPSYMLKVDNSHLNLFIIKLLDKLRITLGWLRGERYITPSPWRKLYLNIILYKHKLTWESRAITGEYTFDDLKLKNIPWVMYPLQMQPEANIDVWGSPWNNQAEIVQRTAAALLKLGGYLVVKPNPKSKYEMSRDLLKVIESSHNILVISHNVPMKKMINEATLVLSVTGTVILECVFNGKPVAVLGEHVMAKYPGVFELSNPEHIISALNQVTSGVFRNASRLERISLLKTFHAKSYAAEIWDPMTRPNFPTKDSTDSLLYAFKSVIGQVRSSV